MAESSLIVAGITEIINGYEVQGKNLSLVLIIADGNRRASIHVLAFMRAFNCFVNLHRINKPMLQRIIKDQYSSTFNRHLGIQV